MESDLIAFLFITDFIADMTFALKIFVLLAIISFIKGNLGTGPFAVILMALASYFVIFDQWKLFGGIYILYVLFFFGLGHLLVDFFFVAQHAPSDDQIAQQMSHIPSQNVPRRGMH
ncbi:MAG: hypothetical protein COT90_05395 [Candidatus Diapherotrites archaeon CG10_big_fil_rev_8_21_14_0_10_31_34]|nr:MAG: hypothetical protein COT90_05395 [Candidatus Diapherotrites archaeon CG10_big_fil_rev_8_21_14_0_10_31_34]